MKKLLFGVVACLLITNLVFLLSCSKESSTELEETSKLKAAPAGTVVVYQNCSYGGYKVTLGVGNYTKSSLASKGVKNDDISSVEVSSGYKVTLYTDDKYKGSSVVKTSNVSCLESAFNNKVSSLKVEKVSTSGTWRKANLTNFESYPDPNSEECVKYNGCLWAGQFAFISGKQTESWVKSHNIIAVHSKDAQKYKLKTLRIRQGSKQIDAVVYDMCSDSDCDGCCTDNANEGGIGFLIDMEKYTMQKFGSGSGVVEWMCVDCQ